MDNVELDWKEVETGAEFRKIAKKVTPSASGAHVLFGIESLVSWMDVGRSAGWLEI